MVSAGPGVVYVRAALCLGEQLRRCITDTVIARLDLPMLLCVPVIGLEDLQGAEKAGASGQANSNLCLEVPTSRRGIIFYVPKKSVQKPKARASTGRCPMVGGRVKRKQTPRV